MNNFEDYAYYYNTFYGDKDYAEEARVVDKLLQKYCMCKTHNANILNIGCGTGKHDFELNALGYKVHGIDLSEKMISIARDKVENYKNISFEVGDFRSYRGNVIYEAVISLFHVMSYQTSNSDVLDSFKTANKNLKSGGILLFDLWYGPGVVNEQPENRIKKVEDEKNLIVRYAHPVMHWNDNIVDVNYDVLIINKENNVASSIQETHRMRYFFKPEIENMLSQSGFELINCYDCLSLEETSNKSWTAYFVAKKNKSL